MDPFLRPDDVRLRSELVASGMTDRDIWRLVRAGVLTRVRHGAYIPSELVKGLDEIAMMRVRSRAVLRRAHPSAVLSHHTALAEHGVPLWGVDPEVVHLTRTDGRAGRREAGVAHHSTATLPSEWHVLAGLPVMGPARATLEVVTASAPEVGLVVASAVLHAGLASRHDLEAAWERTHRWPGSLNARLVLARADARLTSVGESRTWHLFHAHRVPRPEPQVRVHDRHGTLLGIADFAWVDRGVFLEFDGRTKYEVHRRARRESGGVRPAREAPRGSDLRRHRLGVHTHHVGRPRATVRDGPSDPAPPGQPAAYRRVSATRPPPRTVRGVLARFARCKGLNVQKSPLERGLLRQAGQLGIRPRTPCRAQRPRRAGRRRPRGARWPPSGGRRRGTRRGASRPRG